MKRLIRGTCNNPRRFEYEEYLQNHIQNVRNSWNDILKPALINSGYSEDAILSAQKSINVHDYSKYSMEEFCAYCNHYYPAVGFEDDVDAYDIAHNLHIHRNGHHSQHWVTVTDEGNAQIIDMPFKEVCNMICDWHSFSSDASEQSSFDWWQGHKDELVMTDDTKRLVDELIVHMQIPLYEVYTQAI